MSNLIASDAHKQDLGTDSEFIELFKLDMDGTILYFHPGKDATGTPNLDDIQFRDTDGTIRTYVALPVVLTGIEHSTTGASNRPSITIANVLSTLYDVVGVDYDDLIGKKLTRRRTLKKYLVGESGDATPPVEWPKAIYVIDRIANRTNLSVELELASPFDISGVRLPNREVLGKSCPWQYQGQDEGSGCFWPIDSRIWLPTDVGVANFLLFYNKNNEPLIHEDHTQIGNAWTGSVTPDFWGEYTGTPAGGINGHYIVTESVTLTADPDGVPNQTNIDSGRFIPVRIFRNWSSAGLTIDTTDYKLTYVRYGNHIWKALRNHTTAAGLEPSDGSSYWQREDLCGKTLLSCQKRFQVRAGLIGGTPNYTVSEDQMLPNSSHSGASHNLLPFGGFPASEKFRR